MLVERQATDTVAALVERVEIGTAEGGLSRCPDVFTLAAADEAEPRVVTERETKICRQRRVLEPVVRRAIVGGEPLGAERVVERSGGAGNRGVAANRVVGAAFERERRARAAVRSIRPPRHELYDTRHRVRSEERRVRTADDFDLREIVGGEVAEVEDAARLVERDAVEQDFVVVALTAAHEQRRQRTGAAGAQDHHARRRSQEIRDERDLSMRQIVGGERRHARADLIRGRLGPRRADDHRFVNGCDTENDSNGATRRGAARYGGRLEAGRRRFDPAVIGSRVEAEAACFVCERRGDLRAAGIEQSHVRARQRLAGLIDDGAADRAIGCGCSRSSADDGERDERHE